MKDKIRLGIIGISTNNMGSTLLLLKDRPDLRFEITAVCNNIGSIAHQVADAYNIPFWTADYKELVSREDVDAVCVYTPDHLHAQHCIGALENGKHVVCTKPMVTNLEDAKTLVKLVREKKVSLW